MSIETHPSEAGKRSALIRLLPSSVAVGSNIGRNGAGLLRISIEAGSLGSEKD
jgi:hypothetical protein